MEPRLKSIYKTQILPELKSSLRVKNTMQVPKIEKIVINMGNLPCLYLQVTASNRKSGLGHL